jgi:hypothetical protein
MIPFEHSDLVSIGESNSVQSRRWLKWLRVVGALLLLLVAGHFSLRIFYLRYAHQHCLKGATLGLALYANDHEGRFPFHTNGFGDALLMLVTDTNDYARINVITGPGDDGEVYKTAMANHVDVPEEKCSRVYIQGLSETNDPRIAIIFDRYSTRGGDHFRSPFRDPVREVGLICGSMEVIRNEQWPEFSRKQIELLVQANLPRATAQAYYRLPPK